MRSPYYIYRCFRCKTSVKLWCKLPCGHSPLCYDCEKKMEVKDA